jgi:uncharacterized protein (DUF2147 family)
MCWYGAGLARGLRPPKHKASSLMRAISLVVILLLVLVRAACAAPVASLEGRWWTEKKEGIVEIYRCGDMLCGKLLWFRIKPDDPNPQGLDLNNPDPAQRSRPLCGLIFMTGFRPASAPNSWEDGRIYDADNGNTYHANLLLQADGTLSLHGYIGIPLFGAGEIWTRDMQPVPPCPSR